MKEIKNNKVLDKFLLKDYFIKQNIDIHLFEYCRGEILIDPHFNSQYLMFLLKGTIEMYSIDANGDMHVLEYEDEYTILGDVEFVEQRYSDFYASATSNVVVAGINLSLYREQLYNNVTFLQLVLESITSKFIKTTYDKKENFSLEEKVLKYMKYECDYEILNGVEKTAQHLQCSRRQLQRVLKNLVDEGKINKKNKGLYQKI